LLDHELTIDHGDDYTPIASGLNWSDPQPAGPHRGCRTPVMELPSTRDEEGRILVLDQVIVEIHSLSSA
jgi:hypothetical protein